MNIEQKTEQHTSAILDPALLEQHRILAQQLAEIKKQEITLRNEILDILLDGKEAGTHNFTFDGMKVKAVKSYSYSLNADDISEMIQNDQLTEEEAQLLRIKYELKLADYKKAGDTPNLDEALTVKPSQPSLAVTLED